MKLTAEQEEQIEKAASLIKDGQVVGLPTETVYGLAGDISNPASLELIFKTKKRPFFDPLIVHVHSTEQLKELALTVPEIAEKLMKIFWPGPLTFILPKHPKLNNLITSGLETVGVRMPNHPIALELLKRLDHPVAAPSANMFGKTSPTQASHVQKEFGDDVFVIDGGECQVGVESTVIGFKKNKIVIYRPGAVTKEKLEEALKLLEETTYKVIEDESPVAPGHLKHHYMPEIPLVIVDDFEFVGLDKPALMKKLRISEWRPAELRLSDEPEIAARELYSQLRELSSSRANFIFVCYNPKHVSGLWSAIWNRIEKAATINLCQK
ncbi:MAG: L-threonylcarbamoyladenylate synthase [Bdellovibrionota bacterium]